MTTGNNAAPQPEQDWLSRLANRAVASIMGVVDEAVNDNQSRELVRRQVLDQMSLMQYRVRAKLDNLHWHEND